MLKPVKIALSKLLPRNVYFMLRPRDLCAAAAFICNGRLPVSLGQRVWMLRRMYGISARVASPHTVQEILTYVQTILSLPHDHKGVVVEAGCFKGGSTAKFSLAVDLAGRELVVFDSFEGIPENDEPHEKNIFGGKAEFSKGDYCGTLEEVKQNVAAHGKIGCCRFVQGWFDHTMPHFHEPIAAAYIDVDLASSTRTCLKYLFPLLENGGVIYSQDGHLPLVIEVLQDEAFWRDEVGCPKPKMTGLGKKKLVRISKLAQNEGRDARGHRSA